LATILSAAMMLRYSLNLPAEADRIEKAVFGDDPVGSNDAALLVEPPGRGGSH